MTKARIFDKTVAKGLPVTRSKVINIVVNYSAKMEALLVGMRKLMADLHLAALPTGSIDLMNFMEIPAIEILQDLSTLTKDPKTQAASPSLPVDPGSDTRLRFTNKPPCHAPLLEECPQHYGHKGDPGVTPRTCGAIGERAQVILVWVRAPGCWERLSLTATRSHKG